MVLKNNRRKEDPWKILPKILSILRKRWRLLTMLVIAILTFTGMHIFVANARPIQEPGETEFLFVPLNSKSANTSSKSSATNILPIPIVISNPIGGIGNQMFQYACAYSVARSLSTDLWIQVPKAFAALNSSLAASNRASDRHFALANFNINFQKPESDITRNWDENLLSEEPDEREILDYVYGIQDIDDSSGAAPAKFLNIRVYCESETYFKPYKKDIIRSFQFNPDILPSLQTPAITTLLKEISTVESVAVHLRRGDFTTVGGSLYRVLPPSYYTRAMALMKERVANPKYYIFSDDIDYARSLFGEGGNMTYVSTLITDLSLQDFLIMQKCKNIILANSSFSWWAAYLNSIGNKTVIVPLPKYKPWYVYAKYDVFEKYYRIPEFYPSEWVTLNPWE